jgi:hypothetical protein
MILARPESKLLKDGAPMKAKPNLKMNKLVRLLPRPRKRMLLLVTEPTL